MKPEIQQGVISQRTIGAATGCAVNGTMNAVEMLLHLFVPPIYGGK
jgi:hypothetical protein